MGKAGVPSSELRHRGLLSSQSIQHGLHWLALRRTATGEYAQHTSHKLRHLRKQPACQGLLQLLLRSCSLRKGQNCQGSQACSRHVSLCTGSLKASRACNSSLVGAAWHTRGVSWRRCESAATSAESQPRLPGPDLGLSSRGPGTKHPAACRLSGLLSACQAHRLGRHTHPQRLAPGVASPGQGMHGNVQKAGMMCLRPPATRACGAGPVAVGCPAHTAARDACQQ